MTNSFAPNFNNPYDGSTSSESDSSYLQNLENAMGINDYELTDSENEDSIFASENTSESEIMILSDESSIHEPFLTEPSQNIIDEVDEIHDMDYQHVYSEKEDKHHYIGICTEIIQNDELHLPKRSIYLMINSISSATYFRWSHNSILRYLYYYGMTAIHDPKIDIMQLHILEDGTYSVVLKTFWLKLIQRKWKKIFQIRRQTLQNRMQLSSIYHREIFGEWPVHIRNMPGLHGLLAY